MKERSFAEELSDFNRQIKDDATYTVGDAVIVLWTNSGSNYMARGTIAKINQKSILVSLSEELRHLTGCLYPIGQKIKAPRIGTREWTWGNRVYKLDAGEEKSDTVEINPV